MKTTCLYVPQNYVGKGDADDDYRHLILFSVLKRRHHLISRAVHDHLEKVRVANGFVAIPHQSFGIVPQEKLGRLKRELIAEGVLEEHKQNGRAFYSAVAGVCKAYRLGIGFRNSPHKRVIVQKACIAKKIEASRRFNLDTQVAHLDRWLQYIEVQYDLAMEFLLAYRPDGVSDVSEWRRSQLLNLDMIRDKQSYIIKDQYGRVHTPITRMLTELRQFIRFNSDDVSHDTSHSAVAPLSPEGEDPRESDSLVNIDISNSQLLFLFLHMKSSLQKLNAGSTKTESQTYNVLAFESSKPPSDLIDFEHAVLDGSIYSTLMADIGETDRGRFKGQFFQDVLYGDNSNRFYGRTRLRAAFEVRYPTVWRFICQQKAALPEELAAIEAERRSGRRSRFKVKPFAKLARNMQLAESGLVIDRVVGRLAQEAPFVPIATIHDSILTVEHYAELVKTHLLNEFQAFGVAPTLRVEVLAKQPAAACP